MGVKLTPINKMGQAQNWILAAKFKRVKIWY